MAVGGEIIPLAGTADDNPWMGARFSGPLVGRDAELGRLDAALARASRGSSAVVLVGGEAGVGKSRLARRPPTGRERRARACSAAPASRSGQVLVVDPAGDGYAFRHALLHEAVEADLLPGDRRLLHGILARTLAAHPALGHSNPAEAAAELAVHWHASGDQHHALLASVEAGHQAEQVFAFAEAHGHYERALELWATAPASRVEAGTTAHRAGLVDSPAS